MGIAVQTYSPCLVIIIKFEPTVTFPMWKRLILYNSYLIRPLFVSGQVSWQPAVPGSLRGEGYFPSP
jgi:hypothetical protein